MATDSLQRTDLTPEPTEAEYRAFCDTVMASGRGRWFLAEHARRHRKATANDALDALARLESRLHGGRRADTAHITEELRSLAATIRHARLEIGWSDSEFSRGAKVMALLALLEDRIGSLLDDSASDAAPLPVEEKTEPRVQLTVIAANPVPLRGRAELPPVDVVADATIVALPSPMPVPAPALERAPPEPAAQTVEAGVALVALAGEAPASTLAFASVELFEPFEAERPGAERTTVPAPVDFTAEPFDIADIAPQAFEVPAAPEAPLPELPAREARAEQVPATIAPPRPPDYDPMTPVRALSIDERIALVS